VPSLSQILKSCRCDKTDYLTALNICKEVKSLKGISWEEAGKFTVKRSSTTEIEKPLPENVKEAQ